MTHYQLFALFGTPLTVVAFAWGIVGLHRLMPRPAATGGSTSNRPAEAVYRPKRRATSG